LNYATRSSLIAKLASLFSEQR